MGAAVVVAEEAGAEEAAAVEVTGAEEHMVYDTRLLQPWNLRA